MTTIIILISLLIDRVFSEPKILHPLVGFGTIASKTEAKLNPNSSRDTASDKASPFKTRILGILACLLLTVTPVLVLLLINTLLVNNVHVILIIDIVILYLAIGSRSLELHALRVKKSLLDNDIHSARKHISYMVSRETEQLNEEEISKATIESVLENGSDAIFAPLFWYCIAGAPGALLYRLVNTLDAMWGYRNTRYSNFGWCAAKLDDLLNWIPARFTAIAYSLSGNVKQGIYCWRNQTAECESPNAGPVMASGAGALNIKIGGAAIYDGKNKIKSLLGLGEDATALDIDRAINLVKKALLLWITIIFFIDILVWII